MAATEPAAHIVEQAGPHDAAAIGEVCSAAWRATYAGLLSSATIEDVIARYYTVERIADEIAMAGSTDDWLGWVVARADGRVVGAGGGGLTGPGVGEVSVLYLAPDRRGEGIGTALLAAITEQQIRRGAREQWVSVTNGNDRGIPFYEARGFRLVAEVDPWDGVGRCEGIRSLRYRRHIG